MTNVLLLLILAVLLLGRTRSKRVAVWLLKAAGVVVAFIVYVLVIAPYVIDPAVAKIMAQLPVTRFASMIELVLESVVLIAMLLGVAAVLILLKEALRIGSDNGGPGS